MALVTSGLFTYSNGWPSATVWPGSATMRTIGPLTCVMAGVVRSLFQSTVPVVCTVLVQVVFRTAVTFRWANCSGGTVSRLGWAVAASADGDEPAAAGLGLPQPMSKSKGATTTIARAQPLGRVSVNRDLPIQLDYRRSGKGYIVSAFGFGIDRTVASRPPQSLCYIGGKPISGFFGLNHWRIDATP